MDLRASSCGIPTSRAGVTLWLDESYRYVQLFTGDPLPDVRAGASPSSR